MKNLSFSGLPRVLIIDDEEGVREGLRALLQKEGLHVETAATAEDGCRRAAHRGFDVVFLDLNLPGVDGLSILPRLRHGAMPTDVVVLTGYGTVANTVEAMRKGATDVIEKPFSQDRILAVVRRCLETRQLKNELVWLQDRVRELTSTELVGLSPAIREVQNRIDQVAHAPDTTVLITGQSGTGKELVARAIHSQSKRRAAPFVEINSAAIPEDLVESELFGHVKGAFSGALANKKGKFEIADGATLFLDEIGDMSPRVQAKMLRVLEEQRFEPVGSNTAIKVDVRVISATNKRLDWLIDNGNFRADLFYRLNVIPFQVPPLRERSEDIPLLVEHFNRRFSADYGRPAKTFAEDAIEALKKYTWPGNVRELRNTVERVIIMTAKQKIAAADLPSFGTSDEAPAASFRFPSFKAATDAYQREFILHKLAEHDGNVSKAAEEMGVDRSHLYRRMRNLGIHQR